MDLSAYDFSMLADESFWFFPMFFAGFVSAIIAGNVIVYLLALPPSDKDLIKIEELKQKIKAEGDYRD
jgi:membrane protein insertase Oxa1/YidC/SpoIIIJ